MDIQVLRKYSFNFCSWVCGMENFYRLLFLGDPVRKNEPINPRFVKERIIFTTFCQTFENVSKMVIFHLKIFNSLENRPCFREECLQTYQVFKGKSSKTELKISGSHVTCHWYMSNEFKKVDFVVVIVTAGVCPAPFFVNYFQEKWKFHNRKN